LDVVVVAVEMVAEAAEAVAVEDVVQGEEAEVGEDKTCLLSER
jgi:hypothetical protein